MESKKKLLTEEEVTRMIAQRIQYAEQTERAKSAVKEALAYMQGKREALIWAVPMAFIVGFLGGFLLGRIV